MNSSSLEKTYMSNLTQKKNDTASNKSHWTFTVNPSCLVPVTTIATH